MDSFNGKLRDELLDVEICDTLWEAKVLAERWRREYNQRRPHGALAYRLPAPEAQLPRSQALDQIPWSGLQMVPGSNLEGGTHSWGQVTRIQKYSSVNWAQFVESDNFPI